VFSPENDLNALRKAGRQPTADKSLAIISLPNPYASIANTATRGPVATPQT